MHNGCLLLLAFVAVFQPIASYTERGLVDGRHQRCEYRTSVRDPGINFHGTQRFAKSAVEDRRLNQRKDIPEVHRNEILREDSLRTASYQDRRLADTLERNRNTVKEYSRDRIGNDAVLRREVREARLSSYREERNQEIRGVARVQETHQPRFHARRENSKAEYENRSQRTDVRLSNEHRYPVVSRRDTRSNEHNAEARRVNENREIRAAVKRVRDNVASRLNERHLTRGVQRLDIQRSAALIQLEGNTGHEILDLHSRNMELKRVTLRNRVHRAYINENLRVARDETKSLGRDDRRISSQRSVDGRRQLRDVSRLRQTDHPVNAPESSNRMNVRGLQARASENQREARLFERARSTASRREYRDTERTARQIRTARLVDNRVSQDDSSARVFVRERSAENRRDVSDVRSIDRFRALERSTENRKDSRSSDRARVLDNRREIHNMETRKDNRNIALESSDVRFNTRYNNRDTSVYGRERSAEERMIRLARERSHENRPVARNVESGETTTDRVASQRVARNGDVRPSSAMRADRNQRDIRNHAGSRLLRTELTDESRRANRNFEYQAFKPERTEQIQRDVRNVVSRLLRTERDDETQRSASTKGEPDGFRNFGQERATGSRRNIRAFERQSRSLERDTDSNRRDSRNVRDARLKERAPENRQNIRNTESRANNERVIFSRRAVRSLERESRSIGRERTVEKRLNERMVARDSRDSRLERRSEDRREQATETRKHDFRGLDTKEIRRIELRGLNTVRSRDDLAQRNSERAIERFSKSYSLDNRHSYTLKQASRRNTEKSSERDYLALSLRNTEARNGNTADFARKGEFQTMSKNPTHAENETPTRNWQYIFYTVQALYIGGLLMQLYKPSVVKKSRVSWWPAPQHLIKAE